MVDSYVIHIYRRDPERRQLTGTVESIGTEKRRRFSTPEQLWDCLNAAPARRRRRVPARSRSDPQT